MDDPPFEFEVVALTAINPHETLSSTPHGLLGTAIELWDTPKNKVEGN